MRGHGGPVRALAISPDGKRAVSGSFDTSAIRWSLERNVAEQVLRFHDRAVNAVAYLKDGKIVTAGADAKIAIWQPGNPKPVRVLRATPRRSWRSRSRPTASGLPRRRGTARCGCGRSQAVRRASQRPSGQCQWRRLPAGWQRAGLGRLRRNNSHLAAARRRRAPTVTTLPSPLNTVAVAPDGEIMAAGSNSRLYFLSPQGERTGDIDVGQTPVISLAVSRDGKLVAVAGVARLGRDRGAQDRKLLRTLVGPGLPVWSVAFFPDNRTLLTGGTDRIIRRWNVVTGEPIGIGGAHRYRRTRSRPMPTIPAPGCSAPASPATRFRRMKAIAPARRCITCSDAALRPCRATISHLR